MYRLQDRFDGSISLVWADGTNSSLTSGVTPTAIISHISSDFNDAQRNAIRKVASPSAIPSQCPQNFNLFSECFAAVAFYDIPSPGTGPINYTILADGGLVHIDVVKHTSDFEERILPLQWAIDQACGDASRSLSLTDKKTRLSSSYRLGCSYQLHWNGRFRKRQTKSKALIYV